MVDPILPLPGLSPVSGKAVVARFDTGLLSSDGGLLVLRKIEQRLDLAGHPAACIKDPRDPDTDQPVEGRLVIVPPVPAGHVLVQIGVEVLGSESMENAHSPALHVRENAVNPRHKNMCCHFADDTRCMAVALSP